MKRTKYITYLFLFLLYGLLSSCSFEQEDSLLVFTTDYYSIFYR